MDRECRHAGGVELVAEIQTRDSRVRSRRRAQTARRHLDVVPHVADTEIGEQSRAESVIEAGGQALIANFRSSREITDGGVARQREAS